MPGATGQRTAPGANPDRVVWGTNLIFARALSLLVSATLTMIATGLGGYLDRCDPPG